MFPKFILFFYPRSLLEHREDGSLTKTDQNSMNVDDRKA